MKPFIFDQLFRINENMKPPKTGGVGGMPLVLIDDVLHDPKGVREVVGNAPATNWTLREGGRNFVDFYDCRLRYPIFPPVGLIALAHHAIGVQYRLRTEPQQPTIDVNWFMQINPRGANFAVPHQDSQVPGKQTFTCMVYLNSPGECSGGTGFFRFRKTQSLTVDERFETAVRQDPKLQENKEGEYWPRDPDVYWETIGKIEMVTGRMLIFPAQYFHAALHPEDSFFDFPRLTLVFWMVG